MKTVFGIWIPIYKPIRGTKNGIDRLRQVRVMSAWKRRTSFAPTQGLHFSNLWNECYWALLLLNEIWMWKICKKIMLHKPVGVLLLPVLFIFFIHMKKYVNCSICPFTLHITTNVQTLCWSKTSPSGAHSSCISGSINTIFIPQIGMYINNITCDVQATSFHYRYRFQYLGLSLFHYRA